jgi:hypothetical protein
MNGPNSIETASGIFIDLVNPLEEDIVLDDIAWALSRLPRFAGHTISDNPYSIAQHSVFVMELVKKLQRRDDDIINQSFFTHSGAGLPPLAITTETLLHALMHDASEAYLLDVPTPLKRAPGMEAYGTIESNMMGVIWKRSGMKPPTSIEKTVIGWADRYVLTVECFHLMRSRGVDWSYLLPLDLVHLQDFQPVMPWKEAYALFLDWHGAIVDG